MLMARGVIAVRRDHRRQIALFEDPDGVVLKETEHFLHEVERRLEIVEHRERCNDTRALRTEILAYRIEREEVRDQFDMRRVVLPKLHACRIDADKPVVLRVEAQSCAVIAANVDDEITFPE